MYGVWVLVEAFIGYLGITNVDIGAATIKFIAEYYAKKDYEMINRLINTVFVTFLVICLLVSIGFFFSLDWIIVNFFHVSSDAVCSVKFVFLISLTVFVANVVSSAFTSIIGGLQRFDITNIASIVLGYLGAFATYFALEQWWGLKGLVVANGVVSVVGIIFSLWVVNRIFPQVKYNLFLFDFTLLGRVFKFSLKLFATTLSGLLNFHTDKVILGFFFGASYVTFYAIGSRLVEYIRSIPILLMSSVMPAASELQAKQDLAGLETLYLRSQKYVVLLGLPIVAGLLIFVQPFVNLWLGPGYEKSIIVVRILSSIYLISLYTISPTPILTGMGKPIYTTYSSSLSAGLNIILTIIFAKLFGYVGVIYGTAVSMFISIVFFKVIFHRNIHFSFFEMLRTSSIKPSLSVMLASGIISTTYLFYKADSSLTVLACRILLFLFLYGVILIKAGHFDDFDRRILEPYFPKRMLALLC